MIGLVLANRPEIYPALHTVLSVEDLHDVVESILIDAHNSNLVTKQQEQDAKRGDAY
jgi:hypothetical protein